jgi:transposase-like protein
MSGRIYSQDKYDLENIRLKSGYFICPMCNRNNISNQSGPFTLFLDYMCRKCNKIFPKDEVLTIPNLRNKKIDEILRN